MVVPLEVHVDGFPGQHYCPRMKTMNKPAYMAIKAHSPNRPVLIFVSSRRQTRLTALDLISQCALDDMPRRFLNMDPEDLSAYPIKDENLRHTLSFGIGLHHAGLVPSDKQLVQTLFETQQIQVVVATSTLAWGVNFPAHLVIIKGTEYYDARQRGYVDMSITDLLQMLGRAGRPQHDTIGVGRVFVQEQKRHFYRKMLHSPLPVESSLHIQLPNHLNAEVAGGSISTKKMAVEYMKWTFLYRRLSVNPTYYECDGSADEFVTKLVDMALVQLAKSSCVQILGDDLYPMELGRIAMHYYVDHNTVRIFDSNISASVEQALKTLAQAVEYKDHPVRHGEDVINLELQKKVKWEASENKVNLLLQSWLQNVPLKGDYVTDQTSALQDAKRLVRALILVWGKKDANACLKAIELAVMLEKKQVRTKKYHSKDLRREEEGWMICENPAKVEKINRKMTLESKCWLFWISGDLVEVTTEK